MKNFIHAFKYLWKSNDGKKDSYNVKIITGIEEEHKRFEKALQSDNNVLSACKEYLYSIDVTQMSKIETIKSEVKQNEKI